MTTPINLNKARKTRAIARKGQSAAQNRVKFGRTKTEKMRGDLQRTRNKTIIDGAKRDD